MSNPNPKGKSVPEENVPKCGILVNREDKRAPEWNPWWHVWLRRVKDSAFTFYFLPHLNFSERNKSLSWTSTRLGGAKGLCITRLPLYTSEDGFVFMHHGDLTLSESSPFLPSEQSHKSFHKWVRSSGVHKPVISFVFPSFLSNLSPEPHWP